MELCGFIRRLSHAKPAAIEHLVAIGWLINPPVFVFVSLTALMLSRQDWDRFTTLVPSYLRALGALAGPLFFLVSLFVAIYGVRLNSGPPLYVVIRYNFLFYVGATGFGVISVVSLCALLVESKSERQ